MEDSCNQCNILGSSSSRHNSSKTPKLSALFHLDRASLFMGLVKLLTCIYAYCTFQKATATRAASYHTKYHLDS